MSAHKLAKIKNTKLRKTHKIAKPIKTNKITSKRSKKDNNKLPRCVIMTTILTEHITE